MKAYIKATRTVLFPFEQREMFGKVHYVDNDTDKNRLGWEMVEEFEAEHPDFEPVEYQLIMDNSFDKENGKEESFEKYKDLLNLLRTEENKEKQLMEGLLALYEKEDFKSSREVEKAIREQNDVCDAILIEFLKARESLCANAFANSKICL